jgi:hypothetical protein
MNAFQQFSLSTSMERADTQSVARVRSQAALVRALLDELERILPAQSEDVVSVQMVEELARLGCRCFDAAAHLATDLDPIDDSCS